MTGPFIPGSAPLPADGMRKEGSWQAPVTPVGEQSDPPCATTLCSPIAPTSVPMRQDSCVQNTPPAASSIKLLSSTTSQQAIAANPDATPVFEPSIPCRKTTYFGIILPTQVAIGVEFLGSIEKQRRDGSTC